MSEPNGGGAGLDASGLRERLTQKPDAPQQGLSIETASDTVKALNREEEQNGKSEKDKKTYGRTLDGTGESESSWSARQEVVERACLAVLLFEAGLNHVYVLASMLPNATSPEAPNSADTFHV